MIVSSRSTSNLRLGLEVHGRVQGVGFRPFVHRLAQRLGLGGWVLNSGGGVHIEVEGERAILDTFLKALQQEKPPASKISRLESEELDPLGSTVFEIRKSVSDGQTPRLTPDLAVCPECLGELFMPEDRRYRYPFINCIGCGPRYSIIEALPYDRERTTMKHFAMCPQCRLEYENPLDRRFHAQPNACPRCGPSLSLLDADDHLLCKGDEALQAVAEAIRKGEIAAVMGLGGFHLIAHARCEAAIQRLRVTKHRPEKPFALLYPSLEAIERDCEVSPQERELLVSLAAPIVLLQRRSETTLCPSVAQGLPWLGVMLPSTPLYHLLMHDLGFPVVATSGNRSGEPLCIDTDTALRELAGIASLFLVHDRPIARRVDDTVLRVVADRPLILRCGRGYAPLSIDLPSTSAAVFAVGGQLKNSIAFAIGSEAVLSQHVGELGSVAVQGAFEETIDHLSYLYNFQPKVVACDVHPDYRSTQYSHRTNLPVVAVQHHHAHVLACMAENALEGTVLGIAWDGTGFGADGTIWGGEFLKVNPQGYERVAHMYPFNLPGGEAAIREPARQALALLHALLGEETFRRCDLAPLRAISTRQLLILRAMLEQGIHTPSTTSIGRLFDGVAALLGLCLKASFEGQAAMALEGALHGEIHGEAYHFDVVADNSGSLIVDWRPALATLLMDLEAEETAHRISSRFHNGLVEAIVEVAERVGEERVILTGGCFQNRYLTEQSIRRLQSTGFQPYWHHLVPPNDGGLALGQLVGALAKINRG